MIPAVWVLWVVLAWCAWRYMSRIAYQLTTRFRFYALRDRCVALVADNVMDESDQYYQMFYSLTNSLAADASNSDITSFISKINHTVKDDQQGQIARFWREVGMRPPEFQQLVKDCFDAMWISMIDSSTILQTAVLLRIISKSFAKVCAIAADGMETMAMPSRMKAKFADAQATWRISEKIRAYQGCTAA